MLNEMFAEAQQQQEANDDDNADAQSPELGPAHQCLEDFMAKPSPKTLVAAVLKPEQVLQAGVVPGAHRLDGDDAED
jgi:hypothetical protein